MKTLRWLSTALLVSLFAAPMGPAASARTPRAARVDGRGAAPFFAGIEDAASLERVMTARLASAQQMLDRLMTFKGTRTIENTLRPYDDLSMAIADVTGPCSLISQTHPDERMRQAAEGVLRRAGTFSSDVAVNRAVYDALHALDVSRADAETKHYVDRELRAFRLAGVDKDEETQAHLKDLRTDLDAALQEFLRNIRTDTRRITLHSAADLAGLPADFVARHKPDAKGEISIDTTDADVRPVLTFAATENVRKRLYMEWTNVGYPANIAVLQKIVTLRAEIAHLLGYESWAAYDTVDRMSGSARAASDFIDRVVDASRAKAAREFDEVLKRKQQDVPGATDVKAWENTYYSELVRKSSYNFDSQSVRPYFVYDRVKQGLFEIAAKLYGIQIRPADVPVWHPSVEAYDVLENGQRIGRFYLDTHPRPDKASIGAATSTVRSGVAGRQLPEVVLIASLPGGQAGDPGLLTHDEVKSTMFHEFGHVLHAILSGRHEWFGVTRVSERDFLEVPSQMFEEWTWDPATLATFARHYQTNEAIPAALVAQMRHASEFGKALGVRQQMVVARLSLSLHDRNPKTVDSTALLHEITDKYVPFKYVDGTHRQTAFGHLANTNYSSSYYTYMWSLVIAKDLFSQFDGASLLSSPVARRYRNSVLGAGGSKPASAIVSDFLGRAFNATAWEKWLNRESS